MNGIILYQSKYGAAKRYADWLVEKTGFACVETKKANVSRLTGYDTIILCGGVYASSIAGLGFLKKNIAALKGKKLAVFCCGASPLQGDAFREIYQHNLKDELADIPCFYGRGKWDLVHMSLIDRMLCTMLSKAAAKKEAASRTVLEQVLADAANKACDWTDAAYLSPLLDFIND